MQIFFVSSLDQISHNKGQATGHPQRDARCVRHKNRKHQQHCDLAVESNGKATLLEQELDILAHARAKKR